MKFSGITKKLFIYTSSAFFLFLIIIIAFQSTFFDKLYYSEKIHSSKSSMTKFINEYIKIESDNNKTLDLVNEYTQNHNSPILITDNLFNPKYSYAYDPLILSIKTDNNIVKKINLDGFFSFSDYNSIEFNPGDFITVKGFNIDESSETIEPYSINFKGKSYTSQFYSYNSQSDSNNEFKLDFDNFDSSAFQVSGYIIGSKGSFNSSISYDMRIGFMQDALFEVTDSFSFTEIPLYSGSNTDSIAIYEIESNETNEKRILFATKYLNLLNKTEFIVSTISLQPIDEAMSVMKNYFVYFFILAVIFIIILSYIYSKIIAEPLVEMNTIANKMANLDFSVKSKIYTKDELGSLSVSLNTLSNNLHASLKSLENANEKLLDDIEKEKKQDKIRKDFIASVSHELKTPLGIIKGFSEGIKDGIYENKKDYYLNVIIDEIDRMDYMVQEMLELSKLESKTLMISKTTFDMKPIILSLNKKFESEIKKKNLKVNLVLSSCNITADKNKILQVITNFFCNSIRYTPVNGKINIYLNHIENNNPNSIDSFDSISSKNIFYIENSSEKFSEEDIQKVWEKFYRIDKSRSRALGGTGLGLSICKDILQIHNFNFGVKNTELGVMFYFTF